MGIGTHRAGLMTDGAGNQAAVFAWADGPTGFGNMLYWSASLNPFAWGAGELYVPQPDGSILFDGYLNPDGTRTYQAGLDGSLDETAPPDIGGVPHFWSGAGELSSAPGVPVWKCRSARVLHPPAICSLNPFQPPAMCVKVDDFWSSDVSGADLSVLSYHKVVYYAEGLGPYLIEDEQASVKLYLHDHWSW